MPPTKQNNAPSASMRGLAQPPSTDVALQPHLELLEWVRGQTKGLSRSWAILIVGFVAALKAIVDAANRFGSLLDARMQREEQALKTAASALPPQGRAAQLREMRRKLGEGNIRDLLDDMGEERTGLAKAAIEAHKAIVAAIERAMVFTPLAMRADAVTLARVAELRATFKSWGMARSRDYFLVRLKHAPSVDLKHVELEAAALGPLAAEAAEMGGQKLAQQMGTRASREGDVTREWEAALDLQRNIAKLEQRSVNTEELRRVRHLLTILQGVLISLVGPDARPKGPLKSIDWTSDRLGMVDPYQLSEVDEKWPSRWSGPNAASPPQFQLERGLMAAFDPPEGSK